MSKEEVDRMTPAEMHKHFRDFFLSHRYTGNEDHFTFSGSYYKGQEHAGWATCIPGGVVTKDVQDHWLQVAQDLSRERWRLEERLEAAEAEIAALKGRGATVDPLTNALSHSEPRTAWDRR